MSALDFALVRFLLASAGCLAAGLGVWGVTALCRRGLPALAMQRSAWLLGQLTIAAAFAVVLLPHAERLPLVPVIEMDAGIPAQQESIQLPADAPQSLITPPAVQDAPASWLAWSARAWAALYLAGFAVALLRCLRAWRMLDVLAAGGRRVTAGSAAMPAMIEVDAPISPMLLGPIHPRLLLPRHLAQFDALQREMIVEHELTHWRRRDLHWMAAGLALQLLFWFNPFMRLLRARLTWAQELGCDRDVLRGRPPAQRKAYAAALVAQLKLQHRPIGAALAFGGVSADTLAARIALIRAPASGAAGRLARAGAAAGLAGVFLANLALQPALAWHAGVPVDIWPAPAMAQALPAGPLLCTEIADARDGRALVRDGACASRVTPASTFKIPVSLMGFDGGVLQDEHTPTLPFKPGYADWVRAWRAPTDPAAWIKNSVVWYSQQVTTRLGRARVQGYVDGFGYGNRDLSGAAGTDETLSLSELSPSLRISPDEQIAFLRKVVNRSLPLSTHAYEMTARLHRVGTLAGWEVYGKTGSASATKPDGSEDRSITTGWFVGWAVKDGRTLVFARLEQTPRQDIPAGPRAKDAMLGALARQLQSM
jgi:beta-lactamase class D/beta-lactamase regulating signal transducer with metallopeptidase domain